MKNSGARASLSAAIAESWRRSDLAGVSPDMAELPYHSDLPRDSRLLRAAAPVLDQLALHLSDSPVSILLADPSARIIDRRVGIRQFLNTLDRTSVAPGFELSEQASGTNAIGTALESRKLVLVQGNDHYRDALRDLVCAGMPLIHPISQRVEGILDITSRVKDSSPLMIPLVQAAVREIEQQLYEMASIRERATLESFLIASRRGSSAVAAMSNDFVIFNPAASQLLQPSDKPLLWQWATENLQDSENYEGEFTLADASIVSVSARQTVVNGRTSGIVVEFTPRSAIKAIAFSADRPGTQPKKSSTPRLARTIDLEMELIARDPGPTLIIGDSGVGKWHTAQQLHQWWATGELSRWDFALAVPSDMSSWIEQVKKTAEQGNTVVLCHIEFLDNEKTIQLLALLEVASQHNLRIILTGSDSTDKHINNAHAYFRRRLSVLQLHQRTEEIAEIANEILTRLDSTRSKQRLQPAALQALTSQRWPANVRELESVLHAAASRALGGDIGLQHLPQNYRETTNRRPLSTLERIERDALINALEKSGGNKSQTAKILGIARSTLYRKTREYGIDTRTLI